MDVKSRALLSHKVKSPEEIRAVIGAMPRAKKVIMCHGTFDVVHPGHIRHLLYAKGKADLLIASLTSDEHIKKANFRPYVPQDLRALNLAALEIVDFVVIDENAEPLNNLSIIQPDYFAKGYEYHDGGIHPKTREELAVIESYGGEIIFTPGDIVYSSSHIIENAPPNLGVEKLMMLMDAEGITFEDLHGALDKMKGVKVHVVGDTIVDSLTQTTLIGGMTKTPTMSVRFEDREDYVGGAGIVAKHIQAAGADVTYTTVLGDDDYRTFVLDDLKAAGVKVNAIIDPTRPTTNKNAIIAGGYRLLKVDTLDNRSISAKIVDQIKTHVRETASDIVCYCDFRHGMFNKQTCPELNAAIPANVLKVADSQVASRWGNILEFEGFDLITPNEREARFAMGDQDSVVRPLAAELYKAARCSNLILKMGARGILAHRTVDSQDPRHFFTVDTFVDNVVDAVGAGDALLSYASLALRVTGNIVIAAILGNMAAGVECEIDGNEPVTPKAVRAKISKVQNIANFMPPSGAE